MPDGQPPSAPIDLARTQIGLNVAANHDAIQDYLRTGGANLDPATTAWCAAFVNSTLAQSGLKGSGSNLARSFMNVGDAVEKPQPGDIAVFSRGNPNGPYGHVGFFSGYDQNGGIRVVGGNQSKSVSETTFNPSNLLGFRHIQGAVQPGMGDRMAGMLNRATSPGSEPDEPPRRRGGLGDVFALAGNSGGAPMAVSSRPGPVQAVPVLNTNVDPAGIVGPASPQLTGRIGRGVDDPLTPLQPLGTAIFG